MQEVVHHINGASLMFGVAIGIGMCVLVPLLILLALGYKSLRIELIKK